jgi:ParB family chromosome partitioning protein
MLSQQERRRQIRAATPPATPTREELPIRKKRRAKAAATPPAPPKVQRLVSQVRVTTGMEVAPLVLFQLSELNSRKVYSDDQVKEMAGLIEQWGVQQNLLVVPLEEGELGVVAGGRRLRALWLLREQGKIGDTFEVPFQLARTEDGRELSLMENVSRVALTPVEEIECYARIVAEHQQERDPLLYCANRQGVTRAHVEGMIRLGQLAAEILDALRDGRIDIAAARAYATTTDVEAQRTVFAAEERRSFAPHKPAEIRSARRMRSYPADGAEALYVGLDAYHAAGGVSAPELFMGADGGERLVDRALLGRLARAKAELEADVCAIEQGLTGGVLVSVFSAGASWPRCAPGFVSQPGINPEGLQPEVRAASIGVYNLAGDGSGLVREGLMTPMTLPRSAPPVELPSDPPPARPPAALLPRLPRLPADHQPEVEMEQLRARSADRRANLIEQRAAMLAARALATAALTEERIAPDDGAICYHVRHEPVEASPDGDVWVTIQVRVSRDELDAQRNSAAADVDASPALKRGEAA